MIRFAFCACAFGNPWNWLKVEANGAAVQSISSALSVVVGVLTIIVLGITWRAIRRQAIAAEQQTTASLALIVAAQEQTAATKEATAAAQEQSRLLALQYEQSLAPLIVARRMLGGRDGRFSMLQLTNAGAGTTFGIIVVSAKIDLDGQDKSYEMVEFSPSTLGTGDGGETFFNPDAEGFMTIQYRGSDRIDRYTIVSSRSGFWQEHWVRRGTQCVRL